MWFTKKKKEKKSEVIGLEAFTDLRKEPMQIQEPDTIAKHRLLGGAKDRFADRGVKAFNEHKTKVQNQWINPLQSINSGYGTAQTSYYNYQAVNYYECYSLAQDPLFNKIFNILSKTPFANGGQVVSEFDEEQLEALEKGIVKFDVMNKFVKALRSTYVSGGCMLLMDFGLDNYEEPLDLKAMDMRKFRGFIHIDPINLVAVKVNTFNPAASDYMEPEMWYVVGLGNVHKSHFLKFEDNVPEIIMKPMTLYFGMPLTLLIKQDIANSNFASQGLANLINRFRYLYLKTGSENFVTDGAANFRARLEMMSLIQDNFQICPLKDTEEMTQLTTSIQGMADNAEFFYQIIASKTDITLSILLGKGAQGLSGTLQGERKNFYDRMRSEQEMIKPNLLKALGIVQGYITDGKFFEFKDYVFNPLEQSDEREKAENMRSYSEVAARLVELGVNNKDVLEWLKKFKDFNLQNVEFDEEAGDLLNYGDDNFDEEPSETENSKQDEKFAFVMREFKEGKLKTPDGKVVTDSEQAKAIAYSESRKVSNADWQESDHPRDKDGQFKKKGTGDYSGEKDYKQGGKKGSIKTNKKFAEIMERVEKSNKENYTPAEIVKRFLNENPNIKADKILEAIKKADDYRKEKEFTNSKGEKQAADTQLSFTYKNKEGKSIYTPEREKLHKQILESVLKNAKNAKPAKGHRPEFVILGGRGGSGKSKLKGLAYNEENSIVLDADEIKKQLPEYKGYNAWEVHEESSDILKRALQMARQKGLNVVLDGTMSGFASTEKKIEEFENAGYDVSGYYMHLPREESAKRGLGRYLTGGTAEGRYVPLDVMLNMKSNEENFQKLLPKFKKWAMWDNNVKRGEQPILVQKSWN